MKIKNYLEEEGFLDPGFMVLVIGLIIIIVMFVIFAINEQLAGTVTENISDFGYANESHYYVYVKSDDSDIYALFDDIPISDTQVYYLEDETAQSYITYDVVRSGDKCNFKIYSTEKIK